MISVVVPIYNVQEYLEKCIESILSQTYSSLEIILVDDGSTDQSGKICDDYKDRDTRIKVLHKENGGLSSARNAGIELATGEYIGFVDSDDYIDKAMYEVLLQKMVQYNADISICNRFYTEEDGRKFLRYKSDGNELVMDSEHAILEMNSFRSFDMAAWDKLYKRKVFDEIRFPEGKLSEDYFIMYRLFELVDRICYTPEPYYYYMQRKGSISRGKKINFDFVEAAKEQMEYVEKRYPQLKNCVHTAYASANMTVYNFHMKNHVKCSKDVRQKLQDKVKENYSYVKNNMEISKVKKIQTFLFAYMIPIYDCAFRVFKVVKKV